MSSGLTIVVPAYNEELGIEAVLTEMRRVLRASKIEHELIVVDDGSTDATTQAALRSGVRVIRHRSNRGYGAALKTGITAANHEFVAIIDADGTYPAEYLPEFVEKLESADMIVGARVKGKVAIPMVRRPAKWVLNRLANYLTSSNIVDLNSGLRMFRRNAAMQYFPLLPDQFSFTTTITLAMHCDKFAVVYVPIEYLPRKGRSKIVPWDAASFLVLILRTAMLFRPLRVFIPVVVLCLIYGAVKMIVDLTHQPNISASALLAFMSALLILLIGMLGDALATRLGRLNPHGILTVQSDELTIDTVAHSHSQGSK
ncbi:MAG: glycosyltransferase family 2 protein [Bryobacteraceae bacterium]